MRLDDDDVVSLQRELVLLTKREGFVQRRVARTPTLDEVLRGSLDDSFERLRHRFISAIHTLPPAQAELLLDVFALSQETADTPQLMTRRQIHGAKIGRQVDTVRTREEAALKLLHSRLVTGRYAQAPLVLDVPEMHGGIIYEETSARILVRDRRWRATYEHYRFVNMAGEVDYLTIGRSYPGLVTPRTLGRFQVNTRSVDGAGWNDHFWHLNPARTEREPMRDREIYDLDFRITPPEGAEEPAAITLGSRALHHRSLLATIQITFEGELPASIWKFEGASPYARPHTASRYNAVEPDARGTVTMRLRDVHGGLFNGFGWSWASGHDPATTQTSANMP